MLHIATPGYRLHLLEKVYQSIPKHEDIVWHIAKSSTREKLEYTFLHTDKRIKIYEIDCLDHDTVAKRNAIFDNIKDGFFYLLDDDTIFLENVYKIYKEHDQHSFAGMIIGKQKYASTNLFYNAETILSKNPYITHHLDTGMVICHSSVLERVRWHTCKLVPNDCNFWSRCYAHFGDKSTIFVDEIISRYNYFRPELKVNKKILFWRVNFNINNSMMIGLYFSLAKFKRKIYHLLHLQNTKLY